MIILINSIEADIRDTSTLTESSFIITGYTVQYEVDFTAEHSIRGTLKWNAVPDEHKIIKYITWFYEKRNKNIPQSIGETEGEENTN